MREVYLCTHNNTGYVHEVFNNIYQARRFCQLHPDYHIIVRTVKDRCEE